MRAARLVPTLIITALLGACGGADGIDDAPGKAAGNGLNAVVSVSVEAAGAHCANGGSRIDAGLDADRNAVLAAHEITSTQYMCNGAAGAPGPAGSNGLNALVQMLDEPGGANCSAGGKAINVGLDGNANGLLEAGEISSTGYVCSGMNGADGSDGSNGSDGRNGSDGLNTLLSLSGEAAGANCAYGGSRVRMGLDVNVDGVLDAGEVTATSYICNGAPAASLNWVNVTGTAVKAQSNTGYIASNDAAQVVVTLPVSPAVGSVVSVSGAGMGGWKIAQNAGQSVSTVSLGGMAGANWTARADKRLWISVASSADGRKLVAAVNGGQLYTSSDGGLNWTARESDRAWRGVASSADGSKLVATVAAGQIYTSTDNGVSWTPRASIDNWYRVASSADGSKLVAVQNFGRIYTSDDSGQTWTPRESDRYWFSVASSADGSKLVAVARADQIYTSTDSGQNWTPRESVREWRSVASSADGSKLVAVAENDLIYTSTDSGETWTPHESALHWSVVASSADGSKLLAAVANGDFYDSNDGGATWTARMGQGYLPSAAFSADGSQLVGGLFGGNIIISTAATDKGTGGSIAGGASDAIELIHVGNGLFNVLSHEGSLTFQ